MANTLYTYPADFRAQKIIVAAQYAGAKLNVVTDVNQKVLKSKSPLGSAPVLETADGNLTQSNAIARFLAGDKLFGKSAFETAQVNQWVDYCSNNIEVPATMWVYPILGLMKNVTEVTKKATSDLKKAVMTLEMFLKQRTFLVGESITYADVAVAAALLLPFKFVYDDKERKAFPCVVRWFTTVVGQAEFKKVVGSVALCKKKMVAAASAAAAPAPKKQEKKKAAPKAAAAPAPVKKAKHPLELLPKSKFNLDAWKKQYSNAAGGDCYKAMPWFWENIDLEGYSVYFCKYNHNDENTVAFMVSNLVTGFVQRTDAIRKYAFGTMQIIGKDGGPMEIVGAWLFRGDSAEHMIEANPDAEYYTWIKADLSTEEGKKEVTEVWCAEEELYGKPILDGKVFK